MQSAFGIEHEISKQVPPALNYYRRPTIVGAKASAKRGAILLKRGKLKPVDRPAPKPPNREDYIAPDGVQVRWRGGSHG